MWNTILQIKRDLLDPEASILPLLSKVLFVIIGEMIILWSSMQVSILLSLMISVSDIEVLLLALGVVYFLIKITEEVPVCGGMWQESPMDQLDAEVRYRLATLQIKKKIKEYRKKEREKRQYQKRIWNKWIERYPNGPEQMKETLINKYGEKIFRDSGLTYYEHFKKLEKVFGGNYNEQQ